MITKRELQNHIIVLCNRVEELEKTLNLALLNSKLIRRDFDQRIKYLENQSWRKILKGLRYLHRRCEHWD